MDENIVGKIEFSPDTSNLRKNILAITPEGEDPLIFWHQAAQDAIQSAQKQKERHADADRELFDLQRQERLRKAREQNELLHKTIPDFRDLLNRVMNGDFSMNVQLSFYPNTDHVSRRCDYDEE
jgi:hypothetical protein